MKMRKQIPIESYKRKNGWVKRHTKIIKKKKINFNHRINKQTNIYYGVNSKIGPYAGINMRPTRRIRINPRVNLRYGPSANTDFKVSKDLKASFSLSCHNTDFNVKTRIDKNTSISGGFDTYGLYGELKRRRLKLRYPFKY